jgi:hypothetical protein
MRRNAFFVPFLVVIGVARVAPLSALARDTGLAGSVESGMKEVGQFGESPSCLTCRDTARAKSPEAPAASQDAGVLEKHSGEWVAYGMVAESLKGLAAGTQNSYRKKAILELRTSLNAARFDSSDAKSSPAERQAARKKIGELMNSIDGYRRTDGLSEVTRAKELADTLQSSRFAKHGELKSALNRMRFEVDGYGDASKIDELRQRIAEAEAVIGGR